MRIQKAVERVLSLKAHHQEVAERALGAANAELRKSLEALEEAEAQRRAAESDLEAYKAAQLDPANQGMAYAHLRPALHHWAALEGKVTAAAQEVAKREADRERCEALLKQARAEVATARAGHRKMQALHERQLQRARIVAQVLAESEQESQPPAPLTRSELRVAS